MNGDSNEQLAADAARFRWLVKVLEGANIGGILAVNEPRVYHEVPDPWKEVEITWYPDTPVGSYTIEGPTLREVVDAGMSSTWRQDGKEIGPG